VEKKEFLITPISKKTGSVIEMNDTPRSSSSVSSLDESGAHLSTPAAASISPNQSSSSVKRSGSKRSAKKAQESDSQRLAARQKQIDIGKNTIGYQMYLETETEYVLVSYIFVNQQNKT
jgi:hypothetical protein